MKSPKSRRLERERDPGTQVKEAYAVMACAVQTESWVPSFPVLPTPSLLSPASPLEDDLDRGQEKDEDWTPLSEQSEDDTCSGDETVESGLPLQDEKKYVVFESCLLELFTICRTCLMKCEPSLTVKGTLVKVETICKDSHYHTWSSQPVIKGKAAGSLLLSSAIFFSGASPTATLRVLQLMNVQVMTLRMYFNYQSAFLIPTVEKVWTKHQDELLEQLKDSPVDLSGDGRCDSPGFSAKYLTYSVYAPQINKILHCEQVQVGECEEVRASVQMEKQGLIRCLEFLKTKDIKVRSLTTDRHRSIAKHMREVEPEVLHYFDVWHVSKSIKKAITAASKAPGFSALHDWVQAAANHMHWCAAASRGNGDLLVEAWASIARHVADIHNGHGGLYTTCLHGPLDNVEWLPPGHTVSRVWVDTTVASSHDAFTRGLSTGLKQPSGKGQRLIVTHIGSDEGFVDGCLDVFRGQKTGDYHEEMDGARFEKWFDGVLDKLPTGSVIVMDNASYHSRRLEAVPTTSSRKDDIRQWLTSKKISWDPKMVKKQLLDIVALVKPHHLKYRRDTAAETAGCTVVRLPPYHCEFNPIELIWAQIKNGAAA
ncbi:uncharacterized protein ISCGN_013178 [Ixodes scapularis]